MTYALAGNEALEAAKVRKAAAAAVRTAAEPTRLSAGIMPPLGPPTAVPASNTALIAGGLAAAAAVAFFVLKRKKG